MINKYIQKHIQPLSPIPTSTPQAGRLKEEVRCILFDIYGTLFISGSGDISLARQNSPHVDSIRTLLDRHDIQFTPRVLLKKFQDTIKTRHAALRQRGIEFPEVQIDHIWQQVLGTDPKINIEAFAVEFEYITNPVYPMPGLANLLTACRKMGLLMGIISNAQFYTPYLFKWFLGHTPEDLGFSPELVFYSFKFEMAKPSQALFKMAADKLIEKEIAPSSVLYIGNDMLNDIYPSKNSGFQTALFAGDKRSLRLRTEDSRCMDLTADIVVTELCQLIPALQDLARRESN